MDAVKVWEGREDLSQLRSPLGIPTALQFAKTTLKPGAYVDVHCNVLADVEFRYIFGELRALGYVRFDMARFFDTERHTNEFVVQLRRPVG